MCTCTHTSPMVKNNQMLKFIYYAFDPYITVPHSHIGNRHHRAPRCVPCAPWPGSLLWRTAGPVEANPKAAMPSAPRGSGKRPEEMGMAGWEWRKRWSWVFFGEMKDPVSFHSSVTFHGVLVAFWVIEPPAQKNHGCETTFTQLEKHNIDHAAIPGFFP